MCVVQANASCCENVFEESLLKEERENKMGREAHTAPIVIEIEKEKRTAVFIGNLQFVALVEARH